MDQRTYDGHPLLPSSGEFGDQCVHTAVQFHYGGKLRHTLLRLLQREVLHECVMQDVLLDRDVLVKTVLLLDHPYVPAGIYETGLGVEALDPYGPLVGEIDGGQHTDGGGLAGTVGPEESVDLTFADGYVQMIYGSEISESLDETGTFDDRFIRQYHTFLAPLIRSMIKIGPPTIEVITPA